MADSTIVKKPILTLDWWAVLLAVALAALVRFGVLKQVSW
jgi:hypothetical protein